MPRWKINLYILWTSQVISLLSFSLGLPFMSLYIQDFGVTDPNQIKFYTGILSAAPAITMAFVSPIWGRLADRYGRKLMILRAMFAASLIIAAMGMVNAVWQLVALRLFQGLFTGTITAANAFIASNSPSNKMSSSLGFMASANFIGFAIGPIIGGFFAETLGYRFSFYVGGVLMFIGCLVVLLFLVEDKSTYGIIKTKTEGDKQEKRVFTSFIVSLLFVLLFHRILRSIFAPFMALFVQENLGTVSGVASRTGFINGGVAFITAISGIVFGRLGEKYNKKMILVVSMAISIVLSTLLSLTGSLTAFTGFYILLFLFIGGVEPLITSITAEKTAPENRGMLFGYQGTVGSIGMLVSPMIGTFVSVNFSIKAILMLLPVICIVILGLTMKLKYKENTSMEC
jgi:DHA1 family multidrug resistance protein-like MFS transporter